MTGGFTNRIFAVRRYRTLEGDKFEAVGLNGKDDVTDEAIMAVAEHRMHCVVDDCRCGWSTEDWNTFIREQIAAAEAALRQ